VSHYELTGLIVRNRSGALCGYVGVGSDHPLFEVKYDRMAQFDVHGGLTYSDHCQGGICHVPDPGEPDNIWWLGFDCGHGGDLIPAYRSITATRGLFNGTYRNVDYVRAQCESLAEQLVEVAS
jgi:hypothetical protein